MRSALTVYRDLSSFSLLANEVFSFWHPSYNSLFASNRMNSSLSRSSAFHNTNKASGGNKQPRNKLPYILAIMASVAAAGISAKSYAMENKIQTSQTNIKFEDSYHLLKKQENWREIIIQGTMACPQLV